MDNFDKEAFIDEVERRPVIWDTDCQEYSDRILKKRAWDELTEIFADPSYSKEKKSIFNMQLQRKWKNLRDTYIKEYKKIKGNSPSGTSSGSNYIYYTRLSFLQKCLKNKLMTPPSDIKDMEADKVAKAAELLNSMNDSLSELMETASTLEKSSNKSKSSESNHSILSPPLTSTWRNLERMRKDPFVDTLPSYRKPKQSSSKRDQDHHDKLFCLSLYKEIRKVPEQNRLDTKIELLRVLRAAQTLPLNETQPIHQNVKLNALSQKYDEFFKRKLSSLNPHVAPTVMASTSDNFVNMLKPETSVIGSCKSGVGFTSFRPINERKYHMDDVLKYMQISSSETSLSSDCSAFNDTTMHIDSEVSTKH